MSQLGVAGRLIDHLLTVSELALQLNLKASEVAAQFEAARAAGRDLTADELLAASRAAHDAIDAIAGTGE